MARPRSDDSAWLRDQGVTAVLSLTVSPPDIDGFEQIQIPVPDMTSPTLDQLHRAVEFTRDVVAKGGSVVVHCGAGYGRTGTVLAAYLVSEGMSLAEAIGAIRKLRPGSIETPDQEATLVHYAELVGGENR